MIKEQLEKQIKEKKKEVEELLKEANEFYIEFLSGLPVDKIAHCIESRAKTNVIKCYDHILKYYDIPIDDLKYLDKKDLSNLLKLENDEIGIYS